jgi:hypothetical protein
MPFEPALESMSKTSPLLTNPRPSGAAVRDILKLLNDRSAGDLRELSDDELRSFETQCENWRTFVQAELARRAALPQPCPPHISP